MHRVLSQTLGVALSLAAACLLAAPAAHAEGDDGSPGAPRPNLGAFRMPNTLPPAARRAVVPSPWRNLGTISCAPGYTDGGGITRCSPLATCNFTTDSRHSGRYIVHLRAPSSHCAPTMYVMFVDNNPTPRYFGALSAGQIASTSLRVGQGPHTLSIGAIGDTGLGGCNTAGIQTWSADLRLETDEAPE